MWKGRNMKDTTCLQNLNCKIAAIVRATKNTNTPRPDSTQEEMHGSDYLAKSSRRNIEGTTRPAIKDLQSDSRIDVKLNDDVTVNTKSKDCVEN